MERASNPPSWSSPAVGRKDSVRSTVVFGLVLVTVLGGLASFNPVIGVLCSVLVLLLAIVMPRPVLVAYGLTLALPLTGGLAREAVISFLRVSQGLLILGFLLFALARPTILGKMRLSAIDLA